jgi:hypothetical protein
MSPKRYKPEWQQKPLVNLKHFYEELGIAGTHLTDLTDASDPAATG